MTQPEGASIPSEHPLRAAALKFRRSRELASGLTRLVQSHMEGLDGDAMTRREIRADRFAHTVYVAPSVPEDFSVLFGEVVQHWRSVFDYLLWELVRHDSGTDGHSRLTFPVYRSEPDYRKTEARLLGALGASGRALVSACQPYQALATGGAATEHPLWVLNQLSRIDKHRALNLVRVDAHLHSISTKCDSTPPFLWEREPGPIEDGDALASYTVPTGPSSSPTIETEIHARLDLDEQFEGEVIKRGALLGVIDDIGLYTAKTVSRFAELFRTE